MGITGLIQFIENASTKTNIRDFKGSVVAVDAYCWLHKGVYACSETLAMGGTTDIHIKYCLKYINMLLHYNIQPILVFDGQHLPAKELTEKKRRESRKQAKVRAAELLRLGKKSEARKYFNRCVDVSHTMALELMKECRKLGVDCIVAPYEADAQLAFLNISGMADFVVTEDSDLTLFGCKKILFKLDLTGSCLEVDSSKLHLTMGCSLEKYSFQKFRHMCIISGCDYLDSLPGIGLAKACKFILKTEEEDMNRALDKIPAYLNMRHLEVTPEYKLNFMRANATFMHMFVYDPRVRKMIRLTDPSEYNTDIEFCCNAGTVLDDKTAFQLAIGNLDPFSLKQMDNWHPQTKTKTKSLKPAIPSIWESSIDLLIERPAFEKTKEALRHHRQTQNQIVKIDIDEDYLVNSYSMSEEETLARENDLLSTYTNNSPPLKRRRPSINEPAKDNLSVQVPKRNPFYQPHCNSDDSTNLRPLTKTLSPVKRSISMTEKSKTARTPIVISRFFSKPDVKIDKKKTDDIGNSNQEISNEIQQKFLRVKSLYENNIDDALSLYKITEKSVDAKSSIDVERNECKIVSEEISSEILEVASDSETDEKKTDDSETGQTTIAKTLKTFSFTKKLSSKGRISGLRKLKTSLPTNQPSLAQFMFTKKTVT